MSIEVGRTIGQYVILEKIGEGGMGAVYKAEQPAVHRAVALKVLSTNFASDPDALVRFQREVDVLAQLEHPYILPVYDFGTVDGSPYIAMRFMGGGSLRDRLRNRSLAQEQLMRVLDQTAEALDYAHARDIIHRDLKPANLLLDESGNAYLADFGLAKTMEGSRDLTRTGSILGTPAYMSPEQARGEKLDARSDVYAFAVLAFEALAGQLPFHADTAMGYIQAHLTAPPSSITTVAPSLPPAVDEVLRAGLAKDREQRPARATEFMRSLRGALAGAASPMAAPSTGPAPSYTRAAPSRGTSLRSGLPSAAPSAGSIPSARASAGGSAQLGTRLQPGMGQASAASVAAAPGAPVLPRRRGAAAWALPAALLVAVGGVALVVVIVVAALALRGGGGGPKVHVYPVGDSPRDVLFDGQSLWVVNRLGGTLTQLAATDCAETNDPCGQAANTFVLDSANSLPVGLASDGASLWVASSIKLTLFQFDLTTAKEIARYPLTKAPSALLVAGGSLWAANEIDGSVSKIGLDGNVVGTYPVGKHPLAMAYDGQWLWVANHDDGTLSQVDPADGGVQGIYRLDGEPRALVYDGQHLWAALEDRDEVVAVDPANGQVLARVAVGKRPVALVYDGTNLWSADQDANAVSRIDVNAAKVLSSLKVEGGPYALAWAPCGTGCGDLWVANVDTDQVSRLRIQGPASGQ